MLSIVSKYITDSMEESMKVYTDTEEYTRPRHEINLKIAAFRSTLSEAQLNDFLDVLSLIDDANGIMVEKAYSIAFAQGICFREETIK